tara:strand:- start:101 stop:382 length:282 start_codon:yes stop_codon:yes gene_type:complete
LPSSRLNIEQAWRIATSFACTLNSNLYWIHTYSKAIEINPQLDVVYNKHSVVKNNLGDLQGACAENKKAVSLGHQHTARYLNNPDGAWCRNMR